MKKFLIAGLILALLGALAACAYVVLQYFGFVSGYGVNTDETAPFSILEKAVATQNNQCFIALEKALLTNGELDLLLSVQRKDESWNPGNGVWYDSYATHQTLLTGNKPCRLNFHTFYLAEAPNPQISQKPMTREEVESLMASGGPPTQSEVPDAITLQLTYTIPEEPMEEELVLTLYGQALSFRLTPAQESTLEGRFRAVGDLGGLLAEPRLENGHLLVELYKLRTSEFSLSLREVSVLTEDGAVLAGQPLSGASGPTPYDTWDFGPAQPGNYTIEVPYLDLTAEITQPLSIPLVPLNGSFPEDCYPIPGGNVAPAAWTDGPPDPRVPVMPANPGEQARYLRLDLQPNRENLTPVGLGMDLRRTNGEMLMMSTSTAIFDSLPGTGRVLWGLRLSWPEDIPPESLVLQSNPYGSSVSYRWNCPLKIHIQVSD